MVESIVGITMGCPVGIGPEIILKFFTSDTGKNEYKTVVLGDKGVLEYTAKVLNIPARITTWQPGEIVEEGTIPVYELSELKVSQLAWGTPSEITGEAMAGYIEKGVQLALDDVIQALVTCPITKFALYQAGYEYPGHTEMLAALTGAEKYLMMMAGKRLKVSLVTIHEPIKDVPGLLSFVKILETIRITGRALQTDFGLTRPRIAVASLNPHGGEQGMFGDEEELVIKSAIKKCSQEFDVHGPCPPDTVFHQALEGKYDVVVAMYHDQGLIPFKLIHFSDGVNVTLGLPIIRTSVDHGTAYDIAGQGKADCSSLQTAVEMAVEITVNRNRREH